MGDTDGERLNRAVQRRVGGDPRYASARITRYAYREGLTEDALAARLGLSVHQLGGLRLLLAPATAEDLHYVLVWVADAWPTADRDAIAAALAPGT